MRRFVFVLVGLLLIQATASAQTPLPTYAPNIVIVVTPTPEFSATPTETPTDTPTATLTPTATDTPTATPTPIGGELRVYATVAAPGAPDGQRVEYVYTMTAGDSWTVILLFMILAVNVFQLIVAIWSRK